jgi:hypothetical protein
MAFKVGSVTLTPVPQTASANTGSYLTSDGAGGTYWAYQGYVGSATAINTGNWLYRTIYTHGYLACGYKGYNPWRSVNKTWHSSEVTIYCGEQIAFTQGYTNGVWSDHAAYIVAGAGFSIATAIICSYSLHNGTIRTFSAGTFQSGSAPYGYQGNDPKNEGILYGTPGSQGVGGMAMNVAKLDPPATQDIKGQNGYISGGGDTSTQKLHFPSEVMYTTTAAPYTDRGDASYGETLGWYGFAGNSAIHNFSNDAWTAGGWARNTTDVHSKMMGTKHGFFYTEDGTNVTLPKAKINQSSGARISTFNKIRAYGEANYQDGQDNGYCMGHYDGQQNNHTIRQSYSTDIEVTLGAAAMPKGHYGQSSGACSTGAATITATL